ncbi:MAG: GTPase HflX [Chloroflexi bacterium HGW-Chloroflexi-1]|nr:MAG: GTPase HflX [Chloroflexi bacterium HGW-Chloroflexi-1]
MAPQIGLSGIDVQPARETALLVGVEIKGQRTAWRLEDSLAELERLADTAGLRVVGVLEQRLDRPNPATLIGSGKVAELVALRADTGAQVVVFDKELSPGQQRELERAIGDQAVKVLDRTALILDIFAQHARTREGALQVELAQYEYRLPRLTRAWTHLARQAGGAAARGGAAGVGLRGPGETQLEVDRREISRRIAHLKRELEDVRAHRAQYRRRRLEEAIPVIALVGYTNAGKSTLLNALSGADIYVADQLFATLDPTTRRLTLPGGREVLITDTVGFIQKLPTTLVAAFRATLEEITEADLLLHVVDITHDNVELQAAAVMQVLEDLHATEQPIVVALNKVDRLANPAEISAQLADLSNSVAISALTGWGLPELLARIEEILTEELVGVQVLLPYQRGDLLGLFHQRGVISRESHVPEGTRVTGKLPANLLPRYRPYLAPVFERDHVVDPE